MSTTKAKKGLGGSDLPDVSAEDAAAPEVSAKPTEKAAPAVAAAPAKTAEKAKSGAKAKAAKGDDAGVRLMGEVGRLDTLTTTALVTSIFAILLSLFSPLWGPQLVANDSHAVHSSALAVAHLRLHANSSEPFAQDYALIRSAIPSKDHELTLLVASLAPVATSGAPTLEDLKGEFSGIADHLLVGKVMGNEEGWVNWTANKVAETMRLETVASTVGATADKPEFKLLHEAEKDLAAGSLKDAVEKLAGLEGDPAEVVAPWLAKAKRRLAFDETLAKVQELVIERAAAGAHISLN